MPVTLDIDEMFAQFIAEADLRAVHQQSGRHFKGSETELRRAFGKICAPLQDLLEDAAEARDVLKSHGYGTDDMPLTLMVQDLLARLIEAGGVDENPAEPEILEIGLDQLNPNHALDVIMGRVPLEGPKSTLQDAVVAFVESDVTKEPPMAGDLQSEPQATKPHVDYHTGLKILTGQIDSVAAIKAAEVL